MNHKSYNRPFLKMNFLIYYIVNCQMTTINSTNTERHNFTSIIEIEKMYNVLFIDLSNTSESSIIDIFNSKSEISLDSEYKNLLQIQGYYYGTVEKNYDKMKKYYLIAIDKGCFVSMNNLACFYYRIEKNYDEMKKYYLMAIDLGCLESLSNLACYYRNIEKNYDEMKKYYFMAIDKGCSVSMNNLAYYYKDIEKNYDDMKKYYLMAIDKGSINAIVNLAYYYHHIEKNYDEMNKYYLMAIDKGCDTSMYNLAFYYENTEKNHDLMKKYYLMAISTDKKNIQYISDEAKTMIFTDLIDLYNEHEQMKRKFEHFKYHPNGWAFKDIEEEWNLLCK